MCYSLFSSRALLDLILPLFTLTWSLCVMIGRLKPLVSTIKISHDQVSLNWFLFLLRVRLVERGAPQSLSLMESGTVSIGRWLVTDPGVVHWALKLKPLMFFFKILPGVRVIIVNPETRGPLGDSHLGEVSSGKVEAWLDFFIFSYVLFTLKSFLVHKCSVLLTWISDLGKQFPQCKWLLHHLWGGESAGWSFQYQTELWGSPDSVGQNRLPGLHQKDRATWCKWRWEDIRLQLSCPCLFI